MDDVPLCERSRVFLDLVQQRIVQALPRIRQLRPTRRSKPDGSYVTDADLLVEKVLFEQVGESLPEAAIVSEERGSTRPLVSSGTHDGLVVVIDPIDGTENFTSGLLEWGVSISIYAGPKHVSSLLGCPELQLWLRTGQPIEKSTSRIRGLSSSLRKSDLLQIEDGFEYRILGCCVYNLLNVVRGAFHSFENPRGARSWDILAGLNLAVEHGLNVTVESQEYAGQYLPPTEKYRFKIEQRPGVHHREGAEPGRG
jgi:myo-inositol-1(or 4)-monophosphatase